MRASSRTPQQRDRQFARVRRVTQSLLVGSGLSSAALVGFFASTAKTDVVSPSVTTTTTSTTAPTSTTTTAPVTTTTSPVSSTPSPAKTTEPTTAQLGSSLESIEPLRGEEAETEV